MIKNNKKGFSLLELILVISIISTLFFIMFPAYKNIQQRQLLWATAYEMKSDAYLAQQLSLDQSRQYAIEIFENRYRIREQVFGRSPKKTNY